MAEFLYEASLSKTTGAAAGPIAVVVAGASPVRLPEIREIGIFATTAVAGLVELGKPAAAGVTATTSETVQRMNPMDGTAGVSTLVTVHTTPATAPANFLRGIQLPATVGAGVVWTWGPGEFVLPSAGQMAIWQASAAAVTYQVYVKVCE